MVHAATCPGAGGRPNRLLAGGGTVDGSAGLEEGADDYLPTPFSPAELVLRVKRILARTARTGRAEASASTTAGAEAGAATGVRRHGDLTLDPERFEVRIGDRPVALTSRANGRSTRISVARTSLTVPTTSPSVPTTPIPTRR